MVSRMIKRKLPDRSGKLRGTFELTNSIAGYGVASEDPAAVAAGPSRAVSLHLGSDVAHKISEVVFTD